MIFREISTVEQLAEQLAGKADGDIDTMVAALGVDAVLDRVFALLQERFAPARAPSIAATVLWNIVTPAGLRPTWLTVQAGRLAIEKGPARTAHATIDASLPVFLRVVCGSVHGLQAFSDGSLRVVGDETLALLQQQWFDVDRTRARLTISTPRELARLVEGRSDEVLDSAVAATGVDRVLTQICKGMVEHYRESRGPRKRTIVEFSLRTKDGDRILQFVASGGACSYHQGRHEEPQVTLAMRMPTFLRIASGKLDGIRALAQGSIKLRGSLLTARSVPGWFDLRR